MGKDSELLLIRKKDHITSFLFVKKYLIAESSKRLYGGKTLYSVNINKRVSYLSLQTD